LIRVVNLIIGWLLTVNGEVCDLGVYEPDEFHPIYIFFQNVNQMGIPFGCHFVLQMTIGWHPHPIYIFFSIFFWN